MDDDAAHYRDLALPETKPAGMTAVQLERFADPELDGQRARLIFGNDTVYVCSRPEEGVPAGGTRCPYPGKETLLTVKSGAVETVYALDRQSVLTTGKGASEPGRQGIRDVINGDVEMKREPGWFTDMIKGESE